MPVSAPLRAALPCGLTLGLDMRSASRTGHGDRGVNRARVEALRRAPAEAGLLAPGAAAEAP